MTQLDGLGNAIIPGTTYQAWQGFAGHIPGQRNVVVGRGTLLLGSHTFVTSFPGYWVPQGTTDDVMPRTERSFLQ